MKHVIHCNQMNLPQAYFLETQMFRDFTDFGTVEKYAVGFFSLYLNCLQISSFLLRLYLFIPII